jgi:very-short-patch-repair endonuclease
VSKPPTEETLDEIAKALQASPLIKAVDVSTVVHVVVEIDREEHQEIATEAHRDAVYELEGKLIDRFTDVRFDFRTVVKR